MRFFVVLLVVALVVAKTSGETLSSWSYSRGRRRKMSDIEKAEKKVRDMSERIEVLETELQMHKSAARRGGVKWRRVDEKTFARELEAMRREIVEEETEKRLEAIEEMREQLDMKAGIPVVDKHTSKPADIEELLQSGAFQEEVRREVDKIRQAIVEEEATKYQEEMEEMKSQIAAETPDIETLLQSSTFRDEVQREVEAISQSIVEEETKKRIEAIEEMRNQLETEKEKFMESAATSTKQASLPTLEVEELRQMSAFKEEVQREAEVISQSAVDEEKKKRMESLEELRSQLGEEKDTLESQLKEKHEKEMAEVQEQLDSFREEIRQKVVEEGSSRSAAAIEEMKQQMQSEAEQHKKEVSELQETVDTLRDEMKREIESTRDSVVEEETRKRNVAVEEIKKTLESETLLKEQFSKQVKDLEEKIETAEEMIREEVVQVETKKRLAVIEELETDKEESEAQLKEKHRSEVAKLNEQLGSVRKKETEKRIAIIEELELDKEEAETHLKEKHRKEMSSLMERLSDEKDSEISKRTTAIKELEAEKEELEKKLTLKYTTEITSLKQKLDSLSEEIKLLEANRKQQVAVLEHLVTAAKHQPVAKEKMGEF